MTSTMKTVTQDICPACGAWLILAEVQYFNAALGASDGGGGRLVYECPACRHVFERSSRDGAPLLPMSRRSQSLRVRVSAWRHVTEV
jgi:hypothetical protein